MTLPEKANPQKGQSNGRGHGKESGGNRQGRCLHIAAHIGGHTFDGAFHVLLHPFQPTPVQKPFMGFHSGP